jgi:hypothetical protein
VGPPNPPVRLIAALGRIGADPSAQEGEALQRRYLVYMGVLMSLGGLMWGGLAVGLGLYPESAIPFGYTLITAVNFTVYHRTVVGLRTRFGGTVVGLRTRFGGTVVGLRTRFVRTVVGLRTRFGGTRAFERARFVQVLISLLLPFAFQWVLGGFHPSGAIMLWATVALFGSLIFSSARHGLVWLGLFIALTIVSGLIDPWVG